MLRQNFLFDHENFSEYWASAINAVLSYLCIGPKARITITFLLLSICTDEFISTPKIMTFLPTLPSGTENSQRESNPIL